MSNSFMVKPNYQLISYCYLLSILFTTTTLYGQEKIKTIPREELPDRIQSILVDLSPNNSMNDYNTSVTFVVEKGNYLVSSKYKMNQAKVGYVLNEERGHLITNYTYHKGAELPLEIVMAMQEQAGSEDVNWMQHKINHTRESELYTLKTANHKYLFDGDYVFIRKVDL